MIPSSFGRKIPRGIGRQAPKKKNPLGEHVHPPIKGAAQTPAGQRVEPLIKVTKPQVSGQRVEPRIIDPRSKGAKEAMRNIETRVEPPIKISPYIEHPQIVPQQPSCPRSSGLGPRSGIAIIGRFVPWPWKQYPREAYLADALESLGLLVVRISQDRYTPPIRSVEYAIFTSHPASFSRADRWKKTHPTVIWAPAVVPGFPEYDPVLEAARRATLFLSAAQFDWRSSSGISNHIYLPAACDSKAHTFSPRPEIPCAFIGSIYSSRRRQISEIIRKLGGVVLDRMELWKYGLELSKFVQSVKVVVGDNARNDILGFWSARNYIVPGGGGFLLSPKVQGLEQDFIPDQEIAVYGSESELESKIAQWISDDSAREIIRRAGYERARGSHTWEARAKVFLKILSEKIYAK